MCLFVSCCASSSVRISDCISYSILASFVAAEGDSLRTWRLKPFLMVEGGQRWIPPSMTHAEAVVRTAHTGGRSLSDLERDKFENMLRSMTAERAAICEVSHHAAFGRGWRNRRCSNHDYGIGCLIQVCCCEQHAVYACMTHEQGVDTAIWYVSSQN